MILVGNNAVRRELAGAQPGVDEIAVHSRNRVHADLLRAGFLTFAEKRAAAETLEVHLGYHRESPPIALGLTLRQVPKMTDLGRREQ